MCTHIHPTSASSGKCYISTIVYVQKEDKENSVDAYCNILNSMIDILIVYFVNLVKLMSLIIHLCSRAFIFHFLTCVQPFV